MQDYILRQKELISELHKEVRDIVVLLSGELHDEPINTTEEAKETGLMYDLKIITSALDYELCNIKGIKECIRGNGGSR